MFDGTKFEGNPEEPSNPNWERIKQEWALESLRLQDYSLALKRKIKTSFLLSRKRREALYSFGHAIRNRKSRLYGELKYNFRGVFTGNPSIEIISFRDWLQEK